MERFVVAAIFILLALANAHAETDYLCLKHCLSAGTASSSCLPQCSYQRAPTAPSALSARQFSAPRPMASDALIPSKDGPGAGAAYPSAAGISKATGTTVKCVSSCVQTGYQRDYCLQRCPG
ncbi:hypothetical protein SAMN04244559_01282 [Magnetospirillum fulvum]|uniref:Uncharacterized protein n=1 Tax=Magnetospirillum fulvum TaxID=1082 RepID=A0A1H6HEF6_MAGFU|nr:hypothetical protein SAMN04244559_01282 [Magnetospirillum fulvum]